MDSKLIKGQAWIVGDKLVQSQTLFFSNGSTSENTVVLIDDIWADLRSAGTYKSNEKKTYFYWEYQMTDLNDDDLEVTVRIECPRPKDGLYEAPYDSYTPTGDWETYWLGQYKAVATRYEEAYAIKKKQVVFPGTSYINQRGETVNIDENKIDADLGDMMNLLGIF